MSYLVSTSCKMNRMPNTRAPLCLLVCHATATASQQGQPCKSPKELSSFMFKARKCVVARRCAYKPNPPPTGGGSSTWKKQAKLSSTPSWVWFISGASSVSAPNSSMSTTIRASAESERPAKSLLSISMAVEQLDDVEASRSPGAPHSNTRWINQSNSGLQLSKLPDHIHKPQACP